MLSSFLLMAWALIPLATKPLEHGPVARASGSAELIVKLGSRDYRERESATKALDALGSLALQDLRKAAHDKDPEVRRRAETLVETIERREETARLLAPRLVHIKARNVPLAGVIADLAQQSGFSVSLDESVPEEKRKQPITLDTGETTFWQALDALCQATSLVDIPFASQKTGRSAPDIGGNRRLTIEQRQAMYFGSSAGAATHYYLHPSDNPFVQTHAAKAGTVSYVGALRCRIAEQIRVDKDEILLPIEVAPQPNVIWEHLKDIHVDRAIDGLGQDLQQIVTATESNSLEINRAVMGLGNGMIMNAVGGLDALPEPGGLIRLKYGDKRSGSLETLSGTIIGQVRTPVQTLVSVENIRKQAGKSFRTNYGECLEVLGVSELPDGVVKLEVRLKEPPTMLFMPGNGRIAARGNLVLGGQQAVFNRLGVRTNGNLQADLRVKNKEGATLTIQSSHYALTLAGNMLSTQVTMTIKPPHGISELSTLEWAGQHSTTVEVPFKFTNVSLP